MSLFNCSFVLHQLRQLTGRVQRLGVAARVPLRQQSVRQVGRYVEHTTL